MDKLLIVGAGQYGYVVKELAEQTGLYNKIDFLDDNNSIAVGKLTDCERLNVEYSSAIVALGNNLLRKIMIEKLKKHNYTIPNIIHASAIISNSAIIGNGCIIEPGVVINANSVIGDGVIISANATVNHNCRIGDYCHIDVGASVASACEIEPLTKIEKDIPEKQVLYNN